jgi:Zn-dependent membrane protease YugP
MMSYYALGIILLPGIILAIYAEIKVKFTFQKYTNLITEDGRPAYEVARTLLDSAGLHEVDIIRTNGHLTDHYHPKKKYIALSEDVFNSSSVSAIGVACHEVGHAIQYKENYFPMKIRSALIPICNFANNVLWIFIVLGALFFYADFGLTFLWIGTSIFGLSVLLNLVTLPVEYNASNRATELLHSSGILKDYEGKCATEVLRSAGLTYVAGLLISILNFLRLFLVLFTNSKRND